MDEVETILLHMKPLLDDSSQYLDPTLPDEMDDANIDVLLASSSDDTHDVGHDRNYHDEVANDDATRLLDILPNDDPTPLLR